MKLPYLDAVRACEAGATHVLIEPHNDGWLVTPVLPHVVRELREGA